MPQYEVFSTRWDNPHIVDQIPAQGLEFSLPLNDHGEAKFSATVEPGRSFWRASIAPLVSGVLITRDAVPVWSGMVWSDKQSGPRTFDFQCAEWGSFFERVPCPTVAFTNTNDQYIFRTILNLAQAIDGQDAGITTGGSLGSAASDYKVNPWDDKTVERALRELGDAEDGPDWYFSTGGTKENPTRPLVLGDRLGVVTPDTVLEYVEDVEAYAAPAPPPSMTVLGNLFPGQQPQAVVGRGGGNVIAHPARSRDGSVAATVAIAIGAGEESAQLRRTATSTLIGRGFPRLTKTTSYTDVTNATTLQRHANSDLAATNGLVTGYAFTTWDGEPDWTQVQRGSNVKAIIDTDVYDGDRNVLTPRLLDLSVQVPDSGPAQVNWTVSTVLET